MTTTTEPDLLAVDCPFCGAVAGAPCRTHRGQGRDLDWPHSRRIALARRTTHITPARQALCCQCGQVRDFKHARNERATYFGFANWHRELGELNWGHCGHSTTHALLEDPGHRDIHDEMQRVALGEDIKGWDSAKLRRQYREGGLPRNPYLSHRWWIADQDKARAAGASQVTALCGELVDLPEPESANVIPRTDELTAPSEVRDMDYEDPETGLWWVDMDCVDCLRVSNVKKLARIRNELMHELLHLAARTDELGAAEVAEIRERIKLSRSDGNRSG